jgi:2-methylcitrate dehydratase
VDYPKGDPRNPITDPELDAKFHALAGPVLPPGKSKEVASIVRGLEGEKTLDRLMKAMVAG